MEIGLRENTARALLAAAPSALARYDAGEDRPQRTLFAAAEAVSPDSEALAMWRARFEVAHEQRHALDDSLTPDRTADDLIRALAESVDRVRRVQADFGPYEPAAALERELQDQLDLAVALLPRLRAIEERVGALGAQDAEVRRRADDGAARTKLIAQRDWSWIDSAVERTDALLAETEEKGEYLDLALYTQSVGLGRVHSLKSIEIPEPTPVNDESADYGGATDAVPLVDQGWSDTSGDPECPICGACVRDLVVVRGTAMCSSCADAAWEGDTDVWRQVHYGDHDRE